MYLSRLFLNPRSRSVRRDLGSHQDMHRTVLSLFPQLPPEARAAGQSDARQHFGVLHRLDVEPRTGSLTLLIQSRLEPDFSRLEPDYLLTRPPSGAQPAECKALADRYARITSGMTLAFRLRANPTRKIDTKTGPDGRRRNGKRVDLRGEEAWWQWLARKGEASGFRPLEVRTTPDNRAAPDPGGGTARAAGAVPIPNVRVTPDRRTFPRHAAGAATDGASPSSRERRQLTFAAVLFEGLLEVTDPDAFRAALEQGIGSGKAYGFGLLSIAPATSTRTAPAAPVALAAAGSVTRRRAMP